MTHIQYEFEISGTSKWNNTLRTKLKTSNRAGSYWPLCIFTCIRVKLFHLKIVFVYFGIDILVMSFHNKIIKEWTNKENQKRIIRVTRVHARICGHEICT